MKLREAYQLGKILIKAEPTDFLARNDGEWCGCAIGMAFMATHSEEQVNNLLVQVTSRREIVTSTDLLEALREHYPNLNRSMERAISRAFIDFHNGTITEEQLMTVLDAAENETVTSKEEQHADERSLSVR